MLAPSSVVVLPQISGSSKGYGFEKCFTDLSNIAVFRILFLFVFAALKSRKESYNLEMPYL